MNLLYYPLIKSKEKIYQSSKSLNFALIILFLLHYQIILVNLLKRCLQIFKKMRLMVNMQIAIKTLIFKKKYFQKQCQNLSLNNQKKKYIFQVVIYILNMIENYLELWHIFIRVCLKNLFNFLFNQKMLDQMQVIVHSIKQYKILV